MPEEGPVEPTDADETERGEGWRAALAASLGVLLGMVLTELGRGVSRRAER
jgi:hypothetical protein